MLTRYYSAGDTPDIVASWTKTPTSPDDTINKQLQILRARSRQLVKSSDFAPQFVRMCETNIVGNSGVRFCPKSRDANGKLDEMSNKTLEYAWKKWSEDGHCDFNGKLNDERFDKLLIRTVVVDGEAFVQELPGDRYGVSFRLIDPECIPVYYNRGRSKTKNLIRFGIEYDRYDRPLAYFVLDAQGRHLHEGKSYTRISAKHMMHVYIPQMIGQRRGVPWMAAAMFRMKMLTDFEDAALQNAKIGASKVGIISGESANEIADEIDENGERILNTEHIGLYSVEGDAEFSTFDTKFPSENAEQFIKINLRSLAAGIGVNYSTLASDLADVNYSALKHGTTEEREVWKGLQNWLIADWKRPQYLRWLKIALLVGITKASVKLRPEDYEKHAAAEFRGRRWIGPDPLKESSAQTAQINASIKSRRMVIMENGDDPDQVFEEIAQEQELMKKLGIPVLVPNHLLEDGDKNAE